MKLILVCCLNLLATINAFSQTDSSAKKVPPLQGDSLQKKIPAYLPASYLMLGLRYDTSKSRNLFWHQYLQSKIKFIQYLFAI